MLDRVSSGWVHYKLDRGVDHVLIDEAQDTSPRQWDIVAHIISEFTSGAGARDGVMRTIFAVGDEKQSIFSFQGAAPHEFDARRRELKKKFEDAGLKFDPVSFTYSFRSGPAILQSVDHVFRDEDDLPQHPSAETAYPLHEALADAGPEPDRSLGACRLPDDKQDIEGWRAPFDGVSATSPEVKLAKRIQAEIKSLVESGTMTGRAGDRRPLRYGDMLVLVRRRGNAVRRRDPGAEARQYSRRRRRPAEADRAYRDHRPDESRRRAAAAAGRSGARGGAEEPAVRPRRRRSVQAGLAAQGIAARGAGPSRRRRRQIQRRAATSRSMRARALRSETPFAFYAWLLGGDGGRQRILRRLGHEANDALDEFLELALGYERKAPASLQGFMAWLRAADTEVKRDMEISRDEVRVMTVHGAKGLEAPVVFLVDTTTSPSDTQRLRLIHLPQRQRGAERARRRGLGRQKADDPAAVAAARAAMLDETEDEYRRLLYVAMTRAADRLIVGGCMPGNMNTRPQILLVRPDRQGPRAIPDCSLQEFETRGRHGEALFAAGGCRRAATGAAATPTTAAPIALPSWLRTPAPPEAAADNLLRPSDPGRRRRPPRPHRRIDPRARARALQRGTLVHRLLQSLPDVAAERRRDAALGYLARNAADWTEDERAALAGRRAGPDRGPALCGRYSRAGSRAEVSIVGRLERPGRPPALVSGQIDRLVVTPDEVLIVDFKTNHAPPQLAGRGACRPMSASSRSTARCWQKLYPRTAGPRRAALDRNA